MSDRPMHITPDYPEAIILAGGLGTRLRDAVPELPKCMAPVAGQPFLFYVIRYLRMQGIQRFIFSLGYKHEVIEKYLADEFPTLQYATVIESEPLGTGGAIQLACEHATGNTVLVTNGDTLFEVNVDALLSFHDSRKSICTLALKPMTNFDRYGVVQTNSAGTVTSFLEKQKFDQGLINGGTYLVDRTEFLALNLPLKFSFEKDFLEPQVATGKLAGLAQDAYFIDIGIPQDFTRAQQEFATTPLNLAAVNKQWTLFLDRDGVINEDKPGSYIFTPEEFIFSKGAPQLFRKLHEKFQYNIVVTNQRGVGKQLMTLEALDSIHEKMTTAIDAAGGRIDAIFYAPSLDNRDALRKPNTGMAVAAKRQFPAIDFNRSIMVGNNISDMQLGRNAGMYTVFLRTTSPEMKLPHPAIDLIFDTLADFAAAL